jgi:uncharacterized protein (TIGR03083 family)
MDSASLLTSLATDGAALADAAAGHLDRPVATCPDWTADGLVRHVGEVHAWVRQVVAAKGERIGPRHPAASPEEPADLLAWYRAGVADLVEALSVDPETPAWTFSRSAPNTVGWWRRRQALETALHRWDAQAAVGGDPDPDPIAAELAVAGVDELLSDFLPGLLRSRPVQGLARTFHLHATDTPGEWWLDFDRDELTTRREHAKADAAVRGPASGLYLWLWNRQTPAAAGLEVFGRTETIDAWPAVKI